MEYNNSCRKTNTFTIRNLHNSFNQPINIYTMVHIQKHKYLNHRHNVDLKMLYGRKKQRKI